MMLVYNNIVFFRIFQCFFADIAQDVEILRNVYWFCDFAPSQKTILLFMIYACREILDRSFFSHRITQKENRRLFCCCG